MRALRRTIAGLDANESHVLVAGESGTGKELVARALHHGGRRRGGPFVPVDCGSLTPECAPSVFFGEWRRGELVSPGAFQLASGGTLFLDDVSELPLEVQPLLLRVLQERCIRPAGLAAPLAADARIVASTQLDLRQRVAGGAFRADLYYRLNVVRLEVPPLRERRGDVALLSRFFVQRHRPADSALVGIGEDAVSALEARPWPGNVRELENVIESAAALARGTHLRVGDLRSAPDDPAAAADCHGDATLPLSLDAYEKRALERALLECRGDAGAAARVLGIGRSTLYRKLAKHGLRAGSGSAERTSPSPADPSRPGVGVGGPSAIR
jgi:DNA-binding NtrC family response regulator